jgi:hypothetical protein
MTDKAKPVDCWQDVYDLIIATCQDDPEFHARGAAALRFLNRKEDEARALATQEQSK